MNDYPDTFTMVQIQCFFPYDTPWGDDRQTFYDVTVRPTAWFDGIDGYVGSLGSWENDYDRYEAAYLARRAIPTDVTLEVGAEEISGQTYRIQVRVCLEPGGEAKSVRIYAVQVLDHWPYSEDYHRNGFKQAADTTDLDLTPDACEYFELEFTFDDDSWADQDNIKIIVWAQDPEESGPAEAHQSAVLVWPFGSLIEPGTTSLPFFDDFPDPPTIDETLWTGVEGAEIVADGSPGGSINAPSQPNSLNLTGSASGGDKIRTARMDPSPLPHVLVEYWYQRAGDGDSPEVGDDLIVEYLNDSLDWILIATHPGDGGPMTDFAHASHTLTAADIYHANFRVQFRVNSPDVDLDDWFVDDVYVYTTPDTDPPVPNPMMWEVEPAPASTSSITMTAVVATDNWPPIEYFFQSPAGGGHESDWQTSNVYTDEAIGTNVLCTYQVQARDSAEPPNVGEFSTTIITATDIETPTGLTSGTTTETSIEVTVTGTFTNLDLEDSGLFIECLEAGINSGWIDNTTWLADGLAQGTEYTFTAKARNQTQDETEAVQAYFSTTNGGTCATRMGDANGDGLLNGEDVAAFIRIQFDPDPPMEPDDQPVCVYYGDTLEDDLIGFVADLMEP